MQKESIKFWANDDRPREKLREKGRLSLSDAELIAIIIGSGTRTETALDVSRRLLRERGNNKLSLLSRCTIDDLKKVKGIGEAKAIAIIAALELGNRKSGENPEEKIVIQSSETAFKAVQSYLYGLAHEEFFVMHMNRANHLTGITRISSGGITGTVVDTRLVFKSALEKLSTSLILCHNHPSGSLKPSQNDILLTKKLSEAGKTIDIQIVDHLIVTDHGYFSFADEGLLS